jgi:hypothetical protein
MKIKMKTLNMHQHMIFSDDSKLPILGSYTLAQKVSRASRVVTTSLGTSSPENQQQVHVGFLFCLKFLKENNHGLFLYSHCSTQKKKKNTIEKMYQLVDGCCFDFSLFLFLLALVSLLPKKGCIVSVVLENLENQLNYVDNCSKPEN